MLPKAMKRNLAIERNRAQVREAAVALCCDAIKPGADGAEPPPAEPTREAWRMFYAEFSRMFAGLFAATWKETAAELAAERAAYLAKKERG